eukprot:Awhi_evm1s1543
MINNNNLGGECSIRTRHLLFSLVSFAFFMTVYLIIWTLVSPPHTITTILSSNLEGDDIKTTCSRNWFDYSLLLLEILVICYGAVLSYNIRKLKLPKFYNESLIISIVIYNWVFVFLLSQALTIFVKFTTILGEFAVTSVAILYITTTTMILFFGLKVIIVFRGKGNDVEKASVFQAQSQSHRPTIARKETTECSNTRQSLNVSPD